MSRSAEAQAKLASDAMVTTRLEPLIDNRFPRVDSGHYIVSNKGRKVLRVFTKLRHFFRHPELETVDPVVWRENRAMSLASRLRHMRDAWRHVGLAMIVSAAIGANLYQAAELRLPETVSPWAISAVPAALSVTRFHHTANYTALRQVTDTFEAGLTEGATVNASIARALALDDKTLTREYVLLGNYDIGIVDYVRLSFLLFGYNSEGFIYLYFAIIIVSSITFLLRFNKDPGAVLFLVAILSALLVITPSIPLNEQVLSPIAPRVFPIVGILACAHLVLTTLYPAPPLRDIAFVLIQAAIVILAVHVRASAGWEIVAVLLATCGVVAHRWYRRRTIERCAKNKSAGAWQVAVRLVPVVTPILVLCLGWAALAYVKRAAYAPEYARDERIAGHVLWHSIATGLGFQPELARDFHIRVDDMSVMLLTRQFLMDRDQPGTVDLVGLTDPGVTRMRYAAYDQVVRTLVWDICRTRVRECVEAVLFYKPAAYIWNAAFLMGLSATPPTPELQHPVALQQLIKMGSQMRERGANANPLRLAALLPVLAISLFFARDLVAFAAPIAVATAIIVLGSLVPVLVIYPVPFTVADTVTVTIMAIYCLGALGIACVVQLITTRLIWVTKPGPQPARGSASALCTRM